MYFENDRLNKTDGTLSMNDRLSMTNQIIIIIDKNVSLTN